MYFLSYSHLFYSHAVKGKLYLDVILVRDDDDDASIHSFNAQRERKPVFFFIGVLT